MQKEKWEEGGWEVRLGGGGLDPPPPLTFMVTTPFI